MSSQNTHYFMMGALSVLLFESLFQDYLGLEGYIEFCRNNWINIHPAIWIVALVIHFAILIFIGLDKNNEQKSRRLS